MEVKKSVEANLEKGKSLSLFMGLIVALSVVFVSFEWGTQDIHVSQLEQANDLFEIEEILITLPETTPPPPPPPSPVVIEELIIVEDDIEIDDIEFFTDEDDPNSAQPEIYIPPVEIEKEEEDANYIFEVVEEMPEFPGGNSELLKFINKNVKYPVIAQENAIQGRVVCTFTVNQDGSVGDAEVLRGIDPSLDKEALRVIGNMPKWKPGKQRGKPVRVKYTLPIVFRLNN